MKSFTTSKPQGTISAAFLSGNGVDIYILTPEVIQCSSISKLQPQGVITKTGLCQTVWPCNVVGLVIDCHVWGKLNTYFFLVFSFQGGALALDINFNKLSQVVSITLSVLRLSTVIQWVPQLFA